MQVPLTLHYNLDKEGNLVIMVLYKSHALYTSQNTMINNHICCLESVIIFSMVNNLDLKVFYGCFGDVISHVHSWELVNNGLKLVSLLT